VSIGTFVMIPNPSFCPKYNRPTNNRRGSSFVFRWNT